MPVPSNLSLQPELHDKGKDSSLGETSRPTSPASPDSPRSSEDLPQNKLFVGALSVDTTEDILNEFFAGYGEILECSLMRDSELNKSRGFGFIKFKNAESVKKVLDAHSKEPLRINDKIIDPKLAVPKRGTNKVRRIFVGGLSSDTNEVDMQDFFETFGMVEEVQLMYDRNTNRHRGFGFVTFEKPGPAEKVCSIQFHDIKGKKVEVKVAQTKEALALQAGKAKGTSEHSNNGYGIQRSGGPLPFNYSPSYSPFYPPPPYPIEMYGPQFIMGGGGKPRGTSGGPGGGANKMRIANQYSPPAFFGGYSYPPSEPNGHISSPQYFTGFGGMPNPFFIRPDPTLPLGSPPVDFIEQFTAMTIMGGNPYSGMSSGSPPNSLPLSVNSSPFNYQNGETNYSPPTGASPKESPTSTPINGYSQVPNNFNPGKSSYPAMQQTSA